MSDQEISNQLQEQWLEACLSVGIPAVTTDTAARVLAILYVYGGGNEGMVLCKKFTNEVQYIQKRFHIEGGEVPDMKLAGIMKGYIKELEDDYGNIPDWAVTLMRDRYGLKLNK